MECLGERCKKEVGISHREKERLDNLDIHIKQGQKEAKDGGSYSIPSNHFHNGI